MKKELFIISALLLLCMIPFALATVSMSITSPAELSKTANSTSFVIDNTGDETLTFPNVLPSDSIIQDNKGNQVDLTFSPSSIADLAAGSTTTIDVTRSAMPSNFRLGTYSTTISVYAENLSNTTQTTEPVTLSFINSYCEYGNVGTDLEIVRVRDKSSDEDWEWKPLDEVEIEIKVKNNNNDDEIDATIKLELYDDEGDVVDVDDEDDLERDITIDEDDDLTETFILKVPVEDISDGTYKLYVKVFEEGDEDKQCADYSDNLDNTYYQEIKIDKKSREVRIGDIEMTEKTLCGETIKVTARVYNIGRHDEDEVMVSLYNKELGIDLETDVFELDEEDSEKIEFSLQIPQDAEEKSYFLELTAYYDDLERTSDEIKKLIKIEGNCFKEIKNVGITAQAITALAGTPNTISFNIKNTGTVETDYSVSLMGYETWATLGAIFPESFTLEAEQSKSVTATLIPNDNINIGSYTLNAQIDYAGETETKTITVDVQKEAETSEFFEKIKFEIKHNLTWFIAALVLLIAIIVLIVLLSIKKR